MATLVLTNATVLQGTAWTGTAPGPGNPTVSGTINTPTDFTNRVKQVTTNFSVDTPDFTSMADGAFQVVQPGNKSAELTIEFNQDFAASNVDAVFGAAFLAGTLLYLDVKPTGAARSATNPSYVFAGYVKSYPPISNTEGDRGAASVAFAVTGSFARLTS